MAEVDYEARAALNELIKRLQDKGILTDQDAKEIDYNFQDWE